MRATLMVIYVAALAIAAPSFRTKKRVVKRDMNGRGSCRTCLWPFKYNVSNILANFDPLPPLVSI